MTYGNKPWHTFGGALTMLTQGSFKFSNRLLAERCCTEIRDGQIHIVTCHHTGAEMIWSPEEQGTFESAVAEHDAAHDAEWLVEYHANTARIERQVAQRVYRTTEPGDPARRGIGAHL